MKKRKFCPAIWLSGFFALGALVHLARVILGFSLVVAGREIPISASIGLCIGLGVLSVGALALGLKRPCESGQAPEDKGGSCCHQ